MLRAVNESAICAFTGYSRSQEFRRRRLLRFTKGFACSPKTDPIGHANGVPKAGHFVRENNRANGVPKADCQFWPRQRSSEGRSHPWLRGRANGDPKAGRAQDPA